MARRLSTAQIVDALQATDGLIYKAATRLGCAPSTIYKRAERSPLVRQAIEDSRGELVDESESKLRLAVERGDAWAVALVLKTLGKDRGYVERQETVSREETLQIVTRIVRRAPDD